MGRRPLRDAAPARDFVLAQNTDMNEWTNAAGKLMQAAESGSRQDVEAATEALEHALFLGMSLKPVRP